MTEPWDLGFGEKPKNDPTTRYMAVWKASPQGEGALLSLQARAVDGPFAESKELISGFCTIEVPTVADALPWAEMYVAAVGDVELDLRPLYELAELV